MLYIFPVKFFKWFKKSRVLSAQKLPLLLTPCVVFFCMFMLKQSRRCSCEKKLQLAVSNDWSYCTILYLEDDLDSLEQIHEPECQKNHVGFLHKCSIK